MFRTRDFVLLFSTIMFLVVAIGTTLISQGWSELKPSGLTILPENNTQYSATVAGSEAVSRADRVASMRAKIAQQTLLSDASIEVDAEALVVETVATTSDELANAVGAIQCPGYREYTMFWDARDLNWIEGDSTRSLVRGQVGSTTVSEIVIQLPLRSVSSGNPSCLGLDVIGIANDGSLIRNDEVAVYSIFGSETVVGYALDGLPIYGAGSNEVDACGGRLAAGGYRYELQRSGKTILNCFAAAPVNLP